MKTELREKWVALWQDRLGLPDPGNTLGRLSVAYSETHRHYHTMRHVEDCLQALGHLPTPFIDRDTLEAAIWFHDWVYEPTGSANEERSAHLASEALVMAGANPGFINRVSRLVLVTKTHQPDVSLLEASAFMIDIDLTILGACAARFDEYEAEIRREYSWAPTILFAEKRSKLLEAFLQKPRIFHSEVFRDRFEDQARQNLSRSIARLRELRCQRPLVR